MTCSHAVSCNASACMLLCSSLGEMHVAACGATQPVAMVISCTYHSYHWRHFLLIFTLPSYSLCLKGEGDGLSVCPAGCMLIVFLPFTSSSYSPPTHPSLLSFTPPSPSPFIFLQFWPNYWPLSCRFCPNCHRPGDRMHLCVLLLLLGHSHTNNTAYT